MNVLYDLSTLSYCADDPTRFTGIPRAVTELALRLRTSDECSLAFCAVEEHEDAAAFFESSKLFPNASLIPMTNDALLQAFDKRFRASLDSAYDTAGGSSSLPLAARLRLATLHRVRTSLPQSRIPARYVRAAQIFHTPHEPIPHHLREYKHLSFVQMIYDMIPFLMPDKHAPQHIQFYNRVLGSLRPSDWIVTDSQSAKDDFCSYTKFDPERVFVTYLAADTIKFHPKSDGARIAAMRRKYEIPDAPYLLSLCTFEPRKNLIHIIRSFAVLAAQQPDAQDLTLVLAGRKGWNFDAILSEIEGVSESIRSRIIVTGYVDDADLAPLYSGALAFVFMSLYEGFGLPALEAMQCGAPVIASNTSSLPEVVGDAGILLDPTDQEALCQAMIDVYNRPERRDNLSRRSLERAKLFSWERCARETVAVYKRAIGAQELLASRGGSGMRTDS